MAKINFFNENTQYTIKDKRKIRSLIEYIVQKEKKDLVNINFILTNDETMLEINKKYLSHDTYTDTITFPYNEKKKEVWGDVYISIDRVRDNAKTYNNKISEELTRIFIHGTLHLCGYHDKDTTDKKNAMIKKQERYLSDFLNNKN